MRPVCRPSAHLPEILLDSLQIPTIRIALLPLLLAVTTVTAQIPLTPTECQVGDLPSDAGITGVPRREKGCTSTSPIKDSKTCPSVRTRSAHRISVLSYNCSPNEAVSPARGDSPPSAAVFRARARVGVALVAPPTRPPSVTALSLCLGTPSPAHNNNLYRPSFLCLSERCGQPCRVRTAQLSSPLTSRLAAALRCKPPPPQPKHTFVQVCLRKTLITTEIQNSFWETLHK